MNLQEVDKWLDEEFGVSYTKLEELHDFVLEQGLKKEEKLQKQLEAYEKMRKEAIELIENVDVSITEYLHGFGYENRKKDLLNILNKVGEDNDTN